jgi:hypothetical protein
VLTLCGPGGIGKTRLALRRMADSVVLYPDGVWLADLADLRQPELVVPRVAAVLGIREEPGRPLAETLAGALRSRRLLLALDTCEHLLDASAELCQRLLVSSAGVRLLVTSREPLHLAGETAWPVPPLSVPPAGTVPSPADAWRYEAVRLFADRAAAALPGFTLGPGNVAAVAAGRALAGPGPPSQRACSCPAVGRGAALGSEEAVALALGGEGPEAGEGVTALAPGRLAVLRPAERNRRPPARRARRPCCAAPWPPGSARSLP